MNALLYSNFKEPPRLAKVDDPVVDPHGVIVEVKSTGLCLSDWHGWMGHDPDITLPHVPGHELSGVISEVGRQVNLWKEGDRVTLPFVCGCGNCVYCKEGNPQVCNQQFQPGFTNWGSYAEYVSIKYADFNLVSIPDSMSFEAAAILGCRFSTAFRAVVDQGQIAADQWVSIYGCGGVGLSALMIAKALDAKVIAIDNDKSKLNLAIKLEADHVIHGNNHQIGAEIKQLSHGGVHLSLDAVGKSSVIENSLEGLRNGGRHVQIGLLSPEERNISVPFDRLTAYEWQILGSHGIQSSRYHALLNMIDDGRLNPQNLITNTISLKESLIRFPQMNTSNHSGITVINDFTMV